ncbi:hypothetical protein PG996_014110 [Apiospora saccharicola]|uniref:Ankyrin repeat protein n=1 Tax=Apiospora saccharicola TaxID=335842 RepID=A0ABR1THD3_9PEZI
MAHITDLPVELLLGIEEHQDHPVLHGGNALACTSMAMWKKLGGAGAYRRAAKAERDLTTRTTEVLQSVIKNRRDLATPVDDDVAWVRGVARSGMGPRTTDGMVNAFKHGKLEKEKDEDRAPIWVRDERGFTKHECLGYALEDVTRKTLLNRAIMGCRDLEVLERIIDVYADVFPDIFTGACCRPLLELLPIHSAVRARRPEVVRMLVSKGLAPAKIDFLLSREGQFEFRGEEYAANPFNVAALTVRDEDICLVLLGNSNGPDSHNLKSDLASNADSHDESDPESDWLFGSSRSFSGYEPEAAVKATYLAIAEDARMYRLLPALLQYWKQESSPKEDWDPRVILDFVSLEGTTSLMESSDDELYERFPHGRPPRDATIVWGGADGRRPHVIRALLEIGADKEGIGWHGFMGPIQHAVTSAFWKNAGIILKLQARAGRVDPNDLEKALLHAADHMETGRSFLLKAAPKCWQLLERSDRTAEENAQAVGQCMRKCLANSIKPAFEMWKLSGFSNYRYRSRTVALHLIRTGVKPQMSHLRLAILAWDLKLCREIIEFGELDLRAKWGGFAAISCGAMKDFIRRNDWDDDSTNYGDDDSSSDEDEGSGSDGKEGVLNAFEFALLLWEQWQGLDDPYDERSACPALLCDLLYCAGVPDPVAEGVREALVCLFKMYFVNATDPAWRERGAQIKSGSVQFTHEKEGRLLGDVDAPLLDRLTVLCVTLRSWLTTESEG